MFDIFCPGYFHNSRKTRFLANTLYRYNSRVLGNAQIYTRARAIVFHFLWQNSVSAVFFFFFFNIIKRLSVKSYPLTSTCLKMHKFPASILSEDPFRRIEVPRKSSILRQISDRSFYGIRSHRYPRSFYETIHTFMLHYYLLSVILSFSVITFGKFTSTPEFMSTSLRAGPYLTSRFPYVKKGYKMQRHRPGMKILFALSLLRDLRYYFVPLSASARAPLPLPLRPVCHFSRGKLHYGVIARDESPPALLKAPTSPTSPTWCPSCKRDRKGITRRMQGKTKLTKPLLLSYSCSRVFANLRQSDVSCSEC